MTTTEVSTTAVDIRSIETLSRADVPFAGGKGANLGELTGGRAAGSRRRSSSARPSTPAFVDRDRAARRGIEARLDGLDVDDSAALEAAAREVRALVDAEPVPDEIADGDPQRLRARRRRHARRAGRRALLGHRRGHRGGLVRRHERDLPQHPRRRRRRSTRCAAAGRRSSARARSSTAPSAASARPTWTSPSSSSARSTPSAPASCSRSTRRAAPTDRLVIEGSFGLGEAVVSGRVSPDRYVVDKESLSILVREIHRQGGRDRVARRAAAPSCASSRPRRRSQPALTDDEVQRDRRPRPHDRAALRLAAGHRVGDRRRRQDLDAPVAAGHHGPAERRRRPRRPQGAVLLRGLGAAPGAASGPVRVLGTLADAGRVRRRRRARHAHDRARLGAADAPRGRDRDRLRRDDLPRGDRLARARHPLRRRHADRDEDAARRRDRHGRRDARHRARRRARASRQGVRAGRRSQPAAPSATATQLLLNLSEPSQVETGGRARRRRRRPAAGRADGDRGARGHAPAAAARGGPQRRVRRPDGATG